MVHKKWSWVALVAVLALLVAACGDDAEETTTTAPGTTTTAATTTTTAAEPLKIGMILVGPENDRGWSQAHAEAGAYLEEKLGVEIVILDKVNTADRPETTVDQVVTQMINEGAGMIFATSDDMRDGIEIGAAQHPDVPMIWSSGDSAWPEAGDAYRPDLTNLGNTMGRMEYGKMIAGCAAALTTQTGQLGYLGPLINAETRRLASSVYLGAQYCWENYRGEDPADLGFRVDWIGFWFNIPGVTLDPTQVANDFFDSGIDVVISGIDTTEGLVVAGQRAAAGEAVWAIPYDFRGACDEAPDICLGVPYFNWGPAYVRIVQSVLDGNFAAEFEWFGPDWADINDPDTSGIGYVKGPGLSAENADLVDQFIAGLADGSINLFVGPLNYQDGTPFLGDGEVATDLQVWFMEQLLEGMVGASA
ncbi:MAG: BMP family ABC transporter substrate-binding protein [Acidimicrobiia bacterium]|nr:BMP family ABC transporter substrate-binding protein [Acidimicrobiia bacterium]